MDSRGIDTDPGWINRKFDALKREIEALRSERRAAATTIAEGGSLLVRGLLRIAGALDLTGTLSMKSEDGDELLRMGTMDLGDRGFVVMRETGSVAFEVRRLSAGALVEQGVSIYDKNGSRVFSTDDLFGGMRHPFLEHPFQPVAAIPGTPLTCGPYGIERTTTSTTWETLFVYDGKRQNPFLDLKLAALCSNGTTAGEIQIVDLDNANTPLEDFNGVPLLALVPIGTTTYLPLDPNPTQAITGSVDQSQAYIRLGLQVRRTAGAGSITLAVPQSIGG